MAKKQDFFIATKPIYDRILNIKNERDKYKDYYAKYQKKFLETKDERDKYFMKKYRDLYREKSDEYKRELKAYNNLKKMFIR